MTKMTDKTTEGAWGTPNPAPVNADLVCTLCREDLYSGTNGAFRFGEITRDQFSDASELVPDSFLDPRSMLQRHLAGSIEDVYVTRPTLDDKKMTLLRRIVQNLYYHPDCLEQSPLKAALEFLGGSEEEPHQGLTIFPSARQFDLELAVESATCGNVDTGGPGGCNGVLGKTWVVLEWTVGRKKFHETVCQSCAYGKAEGMPPDMTRERLFGPGIKEGA